MTARAAVPGPEPVLFDFRAPPLLSPGARVALETIHTRFATALRALLTPRLREIADAAVSGVDLLASPEYAERFGAGGVRFVGELGTSSASAVLQLGPELAVHCVDRILGGTAEPPHLPRVLTEVERALLNEFVDRMLPLFCQAAAGLIALVPSRSQYVTTPEAPPLVGPGETVAVLRLELRCGALSGPLDVAIPLALLATLPGAATSAALLPDAEVKARVDGHVRLAHVTVAARIGFRASALDVASMQPGTVLSTGHPNHADVQITVNGRQLFTGMLGQHLGHVGVSVLREAPAEANPSRPSRRISPS